MKRLIYCVIITMSISLVFPGGKPCCNKKSGKNVVACKFNQAAIGENKDIPVGLTMENEGGDPKSYKCSTDSENQCAKKTKKTWWKFWAKSNINCPCKQASSVK